MATLEEIKRASEGVRDATEVGENTATRVGGVFCDMADLVGKVMNDVKALQTETLAVLDITEDYTALDFGLSADKDKVENFKTYSAIKEGIYLLKKTELSHIDIAPETDSYMIAGVMFVIKDGMKHCLQELVFTNELIVSGGGHRDDIVFAKFRTWQNGSSAHTPKNAWGKWQDYVSALFEQETINNNVIQGSTLVDGSVSGKKLIDKSISGDALKDGAVTTQKIEDQAVATTKLQDNAVTIEKLDADLQQTIAELSDGEFSRPYIDAKYGLSVGEVNNGNIYTRIDAEGIVMSIDNTDYDIIGIDHAGATFRTDGQGSELYLYYDAGDEPYMAISYYGSYAELNAGHMQLRSEDAYTTISAAYITTPKVVIQDGTSSQLLLANGELAETITTDDINALFK